MANRPAFISTQNRYYPVDVKQVDFKWIPGLAVTQKQKCILSLHEEIRLQKPDASILEISTKSPKELGVALSAFNLSFKHRDKKITVENAYQGSKCFEKGGPFEEIYEMTPIEAKKYFKDRDLGNLTSFQFYKRSWPTYPKTMFYDWIYINTLNKNRELAEAIIHYNTFTDIEFNPNKSYNCQAKSAALYVSLYNQGILEKTLKDEEYYKQLMIDAEQDLL